MNFLALKLDERTKIKIRRWWFNVNDDIGFGLIAIAIFGVGIVATLLYGLVLR